MKSVNRKQLSTAIAILAIAAGGILSVLVLHVPGFAVFLVLALEIAIAFCMHKAPLYLHVGVVAGEVILGVATKNVIFLILCSLVYFCTVLAFHFLLQKEDRNRKKPAE